MTNDDDPFAGIQNVRLASTLSQTDRLKIAIVGKPKSGKSWFAASAPPPVMF